MIVESRSDASESEREEARGHLANIHVHGSQRKFCGTFSTQTLQFDVDANVKRREINSNDQS